jgi:hypothetical protein
MDDGILLQSVEGLEQSPFVANAGEIWESLQSEREEVSRDLLAEGPLCHSCLPERRRRRNQVSHDVSA